MTGPQRQPGVLSRRSRAVLIGGALATFVLLSWFDRVVVAPRRGGVDRLSGHAVARDVARYHGKTFDVARVVDGDTLDVIAPDGRDLLTRVRLLGIDAPETHDANNRPAHFAVEAAAFTRQRLLDQRITLHLDEDGRTRCAYGRLLAYVALADGTVFNEVLVAEGYAYADLRFRHSFYHKYRQLEASARSLRRGLWTEATQADLPAWRQQMQPDLPED